ncbi:hypothetical protein [Streptosporangium sp. KLBMP 9127]|nr:hypothetical protein [Streptosporangium sp. KLBMP 9127]
MTGVTTGAAPGAGRRPALSCAIMAHPARRRSAERIAVRLAALSPTIVYDPDPGGPRSTLRTAVAAWSAVTDGATHHLVVQDDVEPVDDFVPRLRHAVAGHPDKVLCAFTEWGCQTATMVRWGAMHGIGLVECVDNYVPTQATVLPAADATAFAAYAAEHLSWDTPDDIGLRRYLAAGGRSAYALAPNLVDHDAMASLVGNESDGLRPAAWLPARGEAPGGPGVLLAPPRIPTQTWSKGRALCFRYAPESLRMEDSEPTRRVLARRGTAPRPITDRLDAALDAAGRAVDLELHIGYALLHELWVTAVALGALLPAVPGEKEPSPDRAARRALSTMGPGALRCFAGAAVLRECGPVLTDLVVEGVSCGLETR